MFGAQEVTLFGHYFFYTRSQGVAALVSESEANPNNNLMMRRAGLSKEVVQILPSVVWRHVASLLDLAGQAALAATCR